MDAELLLFDLRGIEKLLLFLKRAGSGLFDCYGTLIITLNRGKSPGAGYTNIQSALWSSEQQSRWVTALN